MQIDGFDQKKSIAKVQGINEAIEGELGTMVIKNIHSLLAFMS